MSNALATTSRVFKQLAGDHRTVALVLVMPSLLMVILYFVFDGQMTAFSRVGPALLAIIPFVMMFIVTSVAMLRERTWGTLERLQVSPASRLDIVAGYAVAFAGLALIQAVIIGWIATSWLGVIIEGSVLSLLLVAVLAGVLGMSFGLFFSTFAQNEFQAVQFMPMFALPQFLTCGLFVPQDKMADWLQFLAQLMPLTYIVKAMQEVQEFEQWTSNLWWDVIIVSGFIGLALILGALSLRKS